MVVEWLKKRKNFLVYLGSPGIGKTYFCAALIPWIHGKVNFYSYFNEREILSHLRVIVSEDRGDYIKALGVILENEFFILDDLGSSPINDWRREVMFELVDQRYESEKPTVFTSNLNREQIRDIYGERFYSRLFASENLILDYHLGEDRRTKDKNIYEK